MDEPGVVLLVEDNVDILRNNRRILTQAGHAVRCATTLAGAREELKRGLPNVIVLDILLPDGNGLALCQEIREMYAVPVLLLTALTEKREVIDGLRAGGNDYITKPYDIDEFLARVEAQISLSRRMRGAPDPTVTRGPLMLDTVAMRAFLRGEDVLLTQKEFALLLLLALSDGKPLGTRHLYETVWKQPLAGDGNALWKQLSNLKRKLARCPSVQIVRVRGEGYWLEITE